jgi:hypothetical protein
MTTPTGSERFSRMTLQEVRDFYSKKWAALDAREDELNECEGETQLCYEWTLEKVEEIIQDLKRDFK